MNSESFQTDLQLAEKLLYNECGFQLQHLVWNPESTNYGACSFELNNYKIQYRVANITPTKIGQFAAIWKRNNEGITAPFDVADSLDFMIISVRDSENFGQFIFPKLIDRLVVCSFKRHAMLHTIRHDAIHRPKQSIEKAGNPEMFLGIL
mgnify:CR=1 FL=1